MEDTFYVLKLVTGETLFCEIVESSEESGIRMINPFSVSENQKDNTLSATDWVPFSKREIHRIPFNVVFYISQLNDEFVKFYGSVVIQSKLTKIKRVIEEEMEGGKDYHAVSSSYEMMVETLHFLTDKYDLDASKYDLSQIEKMIKGMSPVLH